MKEFKLNAAATKKDIIAQYDQLLGAHQQKAKELSEAVKRQSQLEKQLQEQAVHHSESATVDSVIENIGRMRGQINTTLNELTDQMTSQAEKLESYNRAILAQERRIKELHDIDVVADTFAKLVDAYGERKSTGEAEFQGMMQDMEATYTAREQELQQSLDAKKDAVETTIAEQREKWQSDKKVQREEWEREIEDAELSRGREEAEYLYQRDRARKVEEDEYQEKRNALVKEMSLLKEETVKKLGDRESALLQREKSMDELEKAVAEFPAKLEQEVNRARKEAIESANEKARHQGQLASVEREWEKKNLEQRIAHLEEVIGSQSQKIDGLNGDLAKAQSQVNEVAKKAIEGASLNRAFQSVNEIALEQARKSDKVSIDKMRS